VYFCDRYYIANNNVIINNLLIYLSTTMNTLTRELKVSSNVFFQYCCTHITRHIIRDIFVATWYFPMTDGYINLFFVGFFSSIFSSVSKWSLYGDRRCRERWPMCTTMTIIIRNLINPMYSWYIPITIYILSKYMTIL